MEMKISLKMRAEDFFNAYLVLRENNHNIINKLENSNSNTEPLYPTMSVDIVCLAFAVELYIKDVYHALGEKTPRKHDILELFQHLPENMRQEIFAHDSISQNPFATRGNIFSVKKPASAYDGFIQQIELISNGFTKWRYSYEFETFKYDTWFAEALIEAMISTANSLRTKPC